MSDVILVEVEVTPPDRPPVTLRFSDRAIRPLPPTDHDRPNAAFDERLVEAPSIRRALFDDMASLTPAIGVGVMTLANADGGLDAYQGHVWGEITVRRWTVGEPFASARILLRGLAVPPTYDHASDRPSRVRVGFYDYRAELSKPVQTSLYAGTNGQAGVLYEGQPDGLKGRPKPLAFGDLTEAQIPAPQVNAGKGVWQLNDGPIKGDVLLFDRGDGAGYLNQGDLPAFAFDGATPAAAAYRTDDARGLVKLNGAPVGQLTFGFKGSSADGYVETAGPIVARILARMGVPDARIGDSVRELAAPAVVGLYVGDEGNADELINWLAAGALASVAPDQEGVWQAVAFEAPAATYDLAIDADQVISLAPDESVTAPAGEIRVGWGRIWTTFLQNDLAPALRQTPEAERLAAEYRWATLADAVLKARLPGAWRTIEISTALRREADAKGLAARLQALFGLRPDGAPRRQWRLTLPLTEEVLGCPLGATIAVDYPPRSIAGTFLLVGAEPMRPKRDQAVWTLWG